MNLSLLQTFSKISGELCNILYIKDYDRAKANALIDELNSKPFKAEIFVNQSIASPLITALCLYIKPSDELLSSKTSHLLNSIITKQNLLLSNEPTKAVYWHMQCLKKCSEMILPDIVHNVQCILHCHSQSGNEIANELIDILLNFINNEKAQHAQNNYLHIALTSVKCVCTITSIPDDKAEVVTNETKERVCRNIISFLLKGFSKYQDEIMFCKIVTIALRILSQLYLGNTNLTIPLPEVIGISQYYLVLGLVVQGARPERVMPSQQTVAPAPVINNTKGGKKQKLRKQRNNAIETLKKEIPADRKPVNQPEDFTASYTPASRNYLEPNRFKVNTWALTSDSDMSDVESGREAKLKALEARVRQSAANLLLVVVKATERKDMFGYWWALLPGSPDATNWTSDEAAKKTLAYCAVSDPVSSNRASVLSVILALLSGSKMYLSQAESCKKQSSFIPFSVTLGYIISCVHEVLVSILDKERIQSVIIVALKCCAAIVQATPYHKMQGGLISEIVKSSRKFLVHRDITLQVGALITMGCVLSVDPKVDEILVSIQKDTTPIKSTINNIQADDECDDFEEGYSDDEMFAIDYKNPPSCDANHNFKSWILDICFKNMGWNFRGVEISKCKPSSIPVILESLQVVSAAAYHHFPTLVQPHLSALPPAFCEMLLFEHPDVPPRAAAAVSVVADAVLKLEQTNQPPPLSQCVAFWEKLLSPLSQILQSDDNPTAKAVACDCIANVGERSFKELPRRNQVLCCTLLVGSCSDVDPLVRAAAVRALAMTVIYRSLREDICFVSDCGENILRALAETSLVVRIKAAWALGNLSDALVLNREDPEIDDIDDDLLLRLLEVSIQCAVDNDKVKMSATRGLGNLLRLIDNENLRRNTQLKPLCETAIEKLMDCAVKGSNMKVRWNACYAMGNAMKNEHLFTNFNGWQRQVFTNLCTLCQECKNIKVRINAAAALRSPNTREHYGEQFANVWRGIMAAMEAAANIVDFNEYRHKDNLIEQLFVTFAHMCCLLKESDLGDIYDHLVFNYDCAKALSTQLCNKLPPENPSCVRILSAAKYVTVELSGKTDTQQQTLGMLQDILIWDT